jgi:tetratricopeptide (TPR) repeat protein
MKTKNKLKIALAILIGYFFLTGCSLHYLDENLHKTLKSKEYANILVKNGDKQFKDKNFDMALKFYDKALSYYEHPVIYKKIAYTLNYLGKYDEAKVVYKYAINLQKGGEKK